MFRNPQYLWLLLVLIPIFLFEFFYRSKHKARLPYTRIDVLKSVYKRSSLWQFLPFALRILAIVCIILALARPRDARKKTEVTGKGIDIVVALDVSGSMQAVDLKPTNRLEAAKKVALNFLNKRHNDKIGLVTFSDFAFTSCPLTLDYTLLSQIVKDVQIDESAQGTAIGLGLATAVGRLRDSDGKSKVIILLTDGRNNAGDIGPGEAAELAATYGIKVYPIGVGKEGLVDYPYRNFFGKTSYQKVDIPIDMETLNDIAKTTGTTVARRAQSTQELEQIFSRIDKLEKTEYKIKNYYEYKEKFWIFLGLAFLLMVLEFILRIPLKIYLP